MANAMPYPGYLPGCWALLPLDWNQFLLLGDWGMCVRVCVNNLPRVVTR